MFKKLIFTVLIGILFHNTNVSSQFPYEKEIFHLQQRKTPRSEVLSFTDVCEEFKNRQKYFTALYDFIGEHQLDDSTLNLFRGHTEFLFGIRQETVPKSLITVNKCNGLCSRKRF